MNGESSLTLADLRQKLAAQHLEILGGFAPDPVEVGLPPGTGTVIMLGPLESGFWPHLTAQPEWGGPDPVDRWSRRLIGQLACDLGAAALFPFGGPPYQPFYNWALRTGRCWPSPVRLLVHDTQGLLVSFRGALALREVLEVPQGQSPCKTCIAKPCLTACPADALGAGGYDVPACHAWLDSMGADCLNGGCMVRRACPVSVGYARMPEQSAYHMGQFHK
ncbi:MAG: ferredoxin [Paracoccaceae bacterium]